MSRIEDTPSDLSKLVTYYEDVFLLPLKRKVEKEGILNELKLDLRDVNLLYSIVFSFDKKTTRRILGFLAAKGRIELKRGQRGPLIIYRQEPEMMEVKK